MEDRETENFWRTGRRWERRRRKGVGWRRTGPTSFSTFSYLTFRDGFGSRVFSFSDRVLYTIRGLHPQSLVFVDDFPVAFPALLFPPPGP